MAFACMFYMMIGHTHLIFCERDFFIGVFWWDCYHKWGGNRAINFHILVFNDAWQVKQK